jgi:hypothetical protein
MPPRKTAAKAQTKAEAVAPEPQVVEISDLDRVRNSSVQAKVAWVQQHVQNVEKTGTVSFGKTNYSHMQEHGLIEVLRPLLREVGLCVTPNITSYERQGNHLQIQGELIVTDVNPKGDRDHWEWQIQAGFVNEGVDTADKASNKALTGWMKYALQKFFLVPTEGIDDNDNSEGQVADRAPAAQPGVERVSAEDAAALKATIDAAVKEGHLTGNRVKALMQGTYNASKLTDLTAEDAAALGQWVEQQVKNGA